MFAVRTLCIVVSNSSACADFPSSRFVDFESDIFSGCLLFSPPFTAYNQKELAEKIREGKYRRIPYRYSEELNTLLSKMLNLKVRSALFNNPMIVTKTVIHFVRNFT